MANDDTKTNSGESIVSGSQRLLPWIRLLRISNLPTAWSNILLGYLIAHGSWRPVTPLLLLLFASSGLYLAGMVLNDFFDFERDRIERPNRPIPSGAISRNAAGAAGVSLLVLGVIAAATGGWLATSGATRLNVTIYAGLMALTIAGLVVLYDGPFKKTSLAPWLMGGCRSFNVLLGASTAASGLPSPLVVWVAISIGVLIAGVTWLGRNEASATQNQSQLYLGAVLIFAGLIGIATSCFCPDSNLQVSDSQKLYFPIFAAMISFPIIRQTLTAATTARPKNIQRTIISVLRSLIIFDALLCYLVASSQPHFALMVVSLLIPTMVLSKIVPPT